MSNPTHLNGSAPEPASVPLVLSPAERNALMRKNGLFPGWLLLSLEEMLSMRSNMTEACNEVNRLKKENHNLKVENKRLRSATVSKIVASVNEAGKADAKRVSSEPGEQSG